MATRFQCKTEYQTFQSILKLRGIITTYCDGTKEYEGTTNSSTLIHIAIQQFLDKQCPKEIVNLLPPFDEA